MSEARAAPKAMKRDMPWIGWRNWFHSDTDVVFGNGETNKAGEQWNINRPNFTGTIGWDEGLKNPGFRFDGSGRSFQSESVNRHVAPADGFKSKGMNWSNRELRGQDFTRIAGAQAEGGKGGSWFEENGGPMRQGHSKSLKRKAASAKIAKIPFALSSWIARTYKPAAERVA